MPRLIGMPLAFAALLAAGCSGGDFDGDFGKPVSAVPPTLTIQAGPRSGTWTNPFTVSNSQTGIPVLQMTLTAGPTEDVRVDSIQFAFDASLAQVGSVSFLQAISLFQDCGVGDGYLSIGFDQILANTNAPQATILFQGLNKIVPAGQQQHWLLIYDMNGSDPGARRYSATFAGPSAVTAAGVSTSFAADVQGSALTGRVILTEARGSLRLLPGAGNPAPANIQGNEAGHKMLHLRIDAGSTENVDITAVAFTHGGSGSATAGVTAVSLYRDTDKDGVYDVGTDPLIGGGPQAFTSFGKAVFTFSPAETVVASQDVQWLALYAFSGAAIPGQTFDLAVNADADVVAAGATSSATVVPTGAPVRGGLMTIPPGQLAVAAGPNMPAAASLTPQVRRAVLQFSLTTSGAEGISLSQIVFANSGTGTTAQIQNIILARDSGATPGQYDPGPVSPDPIIAQNLAILNNTITVTLPPIILLQNQTENWILAYDWAAGANGTYRASVDPALMQAAGASSGAPVTPSGSVVQGNVFTLTPAGPLPSTWNPIAAAGGPGNMVHHTAVYDPPNTRLLFFGGANNVALYGACTNGTYALNVNVVGSESWTTLSPGGSTPAARMGHAACYDSTGQSMVVFGGYDNTTPTPGVLQDVHALNCSAGGNGTWAPVSPSGTAPAGGAFCTAVYDPAGNRIVVFGGFDGTNPRNDVRVLSLGASPAWSAPTTSGGPPAARYGHVAALDAATNQMVVFGGFDGSATRNDVWILDLSTWAWNQPTVGGTAPAARQHPSYGFDGVNRRLYVFGGWDGTAARADVHYFLCSTTTWAALTPGGTAPAARLGAACAYETGNRRLVFQGGGTSVTAPIAAIFQDANDLR